MNKIYSWNNEKNKKLKIERNICFEEILIAIDNNSLLDVIKHYNSEKYPNQKIFIVKFLDYVYMVPFVENENEIFFKTIIHSRKLTKKYLNEKK